MRVFKQLLGLCLVILMLFSLVACREPTSPQVSITPEAERFSPTPSLSTSPSPSLSESPVVTTSTDEISYANMIPDPLLIFVSGEMTVTDPDGGKAYMFFVTGYTQGEWSTYVEKCIELGFNDVQYNSETEFGAYTEDGKYWVQLGIDNDPDTEIVYISCQTSTKNN